MKKKVLKSLLAIVCLLSGTDVSAYDFEVDGFYYDVISMKDGTCRVTKGNSQYTGDIVIPSKFNHDDKTWTVMEIDDYAFSGCNILTSVEIGNSVITIGRDAFSNCSRLTSVEIGNFVTTISSYAFSNCSSLMSVTIPNSVTTIGGWAFENCI